MNARTLRLALFGATAIIATPSLGLAANDGDVPEWVGHQVFYEQSKSQTILYGVGRHPVGRACGSIWVSQAVDFASTRARNSIAEYIGKTTGKSQRRSTAQHTVITVETERHRYDDEGKERPVAGSDTTIEIDDIGTSAAKQTSVERGIKGVRAVRAFYDPATRTIYVLSGKVVKPDEVSLSLLPQMGVSGGQTLYQAERAASSDCGR